MNWEEHWSVLLQGLVASIVGLAGVFAAFWLATRHDRKQERERRVLEAAVATAERRSAAVRRIHAALAMQPRDVLWAPLMGNSAVLELFSAVVDFAHQLGGDHRAVALWLAEQNGRIVSCRLDYRNWCLVPVVRRRKAAAWTRELGAMAEALLRWSDGKLEDAWFEQRTTVTGSQASASLSASAT